MLISDVPIFASHQAAADTAIHFENSRTTIPAFRDRCRRLAVALSRLASSGARVSLLSTNRTEYLECYFGVPGAGMVLNPLNWRLAPRELAYILSDAEPAVAIVEPTWLPMIESLRPQVPSISRVVVLGDAVGGYTSYEQLIADADPRAQLARGDDDDPVWLMYTSGTTGRPKGAVLTHRNLMAGALNTMTSFSLERRDVTLFVFPMFHVAGYVLIAYLLRGCAIVLMRQFDVEKYLKTVERHRITNHTIAPTMLAMVLEHPLLDRYDTSSLRYMAYGASAMPPELLRSAMARWKGVGFATGFGMTELGGNVIHMSADDHLHALEEEPSALLSCGREMPLARVRIIDDASRDVPNGEPGEIAVQGDQVFAGYWRNEKATREAFVDGWFRTGDVGRRDALGRYYVIDRKKDMIVTGGENVYSREVENLLYEHPSVAEAAVVGTPDPKWGEVVTAIVRLKPDAEPDADGLDAFCRAHIAGYKRPRRWVFVDALPKSAAGKILKAELRAQLRDGQLPINKQHP